ncbi:ABC transporter ATP-binding protein [Sphingosinicellaceae bacterium]|nr:ABC transporter ATP-binding protein [Sphingosinicellaceae bacterium]
MRPPDPTVEVRGLGKAFAGKTVVGNVSMTLHAGQTIGLVGANGGGKTTTLRMLAGLLRPDAGEGQVLGYDIRRAPDARRGIGYMSQRLALYPDLTVAENLRFRARLLSLEPEALAELVARFGLGLQLGTRFGRLSGGWARRVQFAATLLGRPALLLLDEPTAGLDVATRRDIWRWLGELAAEGTATIISTHDLAEAENCPLILHYADGRAEGPIDPAALTAAAGTKSLEAAVIARAVAAR